MLLLKLLVVLFYVNS